MTKISKEEAELYVRQYLKQLALQWADAVHDPTMTTCIECGIERGKKGGWGRCSTHYCKRKRHALKEACVELLGGRCSRCGGQFPMVCFDFHHLEDKEFSIGRSIKRTGVNDLVREVLKCVLLCANCHRMEHTHDHL